MVGPSPYGYGPEFSKPLRWRLSELRDRLRRPTRRSNGRAILGGVADLTYSANPGCVASVTTGGSPRQCGGPEAAAVPHRYRYPRPQQARLYVCETHAREFSAAEPLTEEDHHEIAVRRRRRDEQMARVTVGPYAVQNDEERPAPGEGAGR